ncbi:hypothetical protein AB4527_18595, partial [Vibrio breoganii]
FIFCGFISAYENEIIDNQVIVTICFISLITLFLLATFSIGRFEYGERFNGFFNDPNQMAYWAVCVYCSLNLVNKNRAISILGLIILIFIVISTQSRSGLLGILVIVVALIIDNIRLMLASYIKLAVLVMILAVCSITVLVNITLLPKPEVTQKSETLSRVENTDAREQLEIRGYLRPIDYPEFLIFGAGKGLENRFGTTNEIHSSWISIIFYYGIPGTILFSFFIYNVFKENSIVVILIGVAPFIYGISTYGLRTPIFWFFLATLIHAKKNRLYIQ